VERTVARGDCRAHAFSLRPANEVDRVRSIAHQSVEDWRRACRGRGPQLNCATPSELLRSKPRTVNQGSQLRPHDRRVYTLYEWSLSEAAVDSSHEVVRADEFAEPYQPLGYQFGMLNDISREITPGISLRPFGSLTFSHTCHSCSWRGLAISSK
jgi:hypothetical protein